MQHAQGEVSVRTLTFLVIVCLAVCVEAEAGFEKRPVVSAEKTFLEGDYTRAIAEADRCIGLSYSAAEKEELSYMKALALLKQKKYRDAWSIFEAMRVSFPRGRRFFVAELGIGDTYYCEGDYKSAIDAYQKVIEHDPLNRNLGVVYYKLGTCYNASGDRARARSCFAQVTELAPLSFEARMIPVVEDVPAEASCGAAKGYFSVQVGAFKTKKNAENLIAELSAKSYEGCYIETPEVSGETLYKVRIGKSATHKEAEGLAAKLRRDGYTTKICP